MTKQKKNKSVASVRARTIPTERQSLVVEVSTNFRGQRVLCGQRNGSPRPCSRFSRPTNHDNLRFSVYSTTSCVVQPNSLHSTMFSENQSLFTLVLVLKITFKTHRQQEVLGRINRLVSFDSTRKSYETSPTILLLLVQPLLQ
jgi:hypothetical protein